MKFTQIPATTFEELQLNAGIFLKDFSPETATVNTGDILGATTGGASFTDTPTYEDFGADIDNAPRNTKELKRITEREVQITGTFLTINGDVAKSLAGSADVATDSPAKGISKITPRDTLKDADFTDLWWVGDYSDDNDNETGGFIAIHLINALSTGGFSLQSSDRAKGQFAFTYMAHYSISDIDKVPYEIYIKAGTASGE